MKGCAVNLIRNTIADKRGNLMVATTGENLNDTLKRWVSLSKPMKLRHLVDLILLWLHCVLCTNLEKARKVFIHIWSIPFD